MWNRKLRFRQHAADFSWFFGTMKAIKGLLKTLFRAHGWEKPYDCGIPLKGGT